MQLMRLPLFEIVDTKTDSALFLASGMSD